MSTLMQASRQWATRPDDERYTSLTDMHEHFKLIHSRSAEKVIPSRRLHIVPDVDNVGINVVGANGTPYAPTHWAFSQLSQLAEAPAGYLRTMPAPIAADCLNYGLQFKRNIEDVGILLQRQDEDLLRAATGPRYGRIWNHDILRKLTKKFGDGVSGDWKVPGEFGKDVTVTKANTTLFSGDRDMFVFLADERNRIEIPNRRSGTSGSLARGFFVWNSEVGSSTFGLGTFLFDYVCCNRIVWGAKEYNEIRIRHTVSAPDRFIDEMYPALQRYADSSAKSITDGVKKAQEARLGEKLDDFLATRFGKRLVPVLKATHEVEEQRPIESLWDVATAATAYARGITWQNERVEIERKAGEVLTLAAA